MDEEPDPAVLAAQEKERSGRYVAPSLRPDARGGQMDNRRFVLDKGAVVIHIQYNETSYMVGRMSSNIV